MRFIRSDCQEQLQTAKVASNFGPFVALFLEILRYFIVAEVAITMSMPMCRCCGAFRPPRIPFIRISEADHGRAAHPCSTECTRRVPLLAPAGTPALLVRYPGQAHPFLGARHRPAPQLGHAQRTGLLRSHGPGPHRGRAARWLRPAGHRHGTHRNDRPPGP